MFPAKGTEADCVALCSLSKEAQIAEPGLRWEVLLKDLERGMLLSGARVPLC